MKDNHSISLSVIIPTLNESAYLPLLLDALDNQTQRPDEVIVADAGSHDNTVEFALKHGSKVVTGGSPSFGRNSGAANSSSELLLFLDADVVPRPEFIQDLISEFSRRHLDMATCWISALGEHPLENFLCSGASAFFFLSQHTIPHAPGFCILVKRNLHEKIGGFDEMLPISEDTDYARRGNQNGRFGVISNVTIPVSMRRIKKEGVFTLGIKYGWCEIFAIQGKPVRHMPFKYEFGAFK